MQKAKPGYKTVKWLFGKEIEIPQDWEMKKCSEILNLRHGFQFRDEDFIQSKKGIKIIKIGNLKKTGGIDLENCDLISLKRERDFMNVIINTDDVLMALTGATLGKTILVPKINEKLLQNYRVGNFFPKTNIKKFFLYYSLKNIFTQKQIWFLVNSNAQPNIGKEDFDKIKVILPPLLEQQKIASVLSNIDNLINSYNKTIESTKKLKKGLMQTLLTRGIGHKKFKKVYDRFRNEFEIPEEWMYVKIKDLLIDKKILEIQDGNHGELHPKSSDFIENGIPFITADCLIDNKINYSKCKYLDKKFLKTLRIGFAKVGDVILSHKGSIGNSSIMNEEYEEVILSPQTTYYRISDQINQHFLHYIFQSYDFQKQLKSFAKQSTRDYVGITNQQNLFIPFVSSKEEQQKIALILTSVDDEIIKLESKKKSAEFLKKGLMQKLLTGQIRVKV